MPPVIQFPMEKEVIYHPLTCAALPQIKTGTLHSTNLLILPVPSRRVAGQLVVVLLHVGRPRHDVLDWLGDLHQRHAGILGVDQSLVISFALFDAVALVDPLHLSDRELK